MNRRSSRLVRLRVSLLGAVLVAVPLAFSPPAARAAAAVPDRQSPAPAATAAPAAVTAKPADYAYDAAGQLRGVSQTPGGASARYSYDDDGNLTSVTRAAAGALTVSSIAPSRAPAGTAVTLTGTGFATTATSNTVKFNGTAATVAKATATSLVATVPGGASSGTVSVTTGSATATSEQSFTVTAALPAPSMTTFNPDYGSTGDSIVITGAGFDSTPSGDNVSFGHTRARVTAASTTSLTVTVPENAGTGPLTVVTAGGTATNVTTDPFYVLPVPYKFADVAFTHQLLIDDQSSQLTLSTAGKVVLLRFSGTKGQRLSLGVSSSTLGTVSIAGYDTFGAPFGRGEFDAPQELPSGIDPWTLPVLPASGIYTMVLKADSSTATGQVTLALSTRQAGALDLNGAGTTATFDRPGKVAEFTVDAATAGQQIGLGFTGSTLTSPYVDVEIREPNGTSLQWTDSLGVPNAKTMVTLNGQKLDFTAPLAGRYTILLTPSLPLTASGQVTVTASAVLDAGALTVGTAKQITVRAGQNARTTFTGTANQLLAVDVVANTVYAPQFTLTGPTGTVVLTKNAAANGWLELPALPAAGTYTLTVTANSSAGPISLTLLQRQTAGTVTTTGAAVTATFSPAGVLNEITVPGTAGQTLSFAFSNRTLPTTNTLRSRIVDPAGKAVVSDLTINNLGTFTWTPTVTGNYRMLLTSGGGTGAVTVTDSTLIAGGTLTLGTAVTATSARTGQITSYTFAGTSGQHLGLDVTANSYPNKGYGLLVRPDGSSTFLSLSQAWRALDPLPSTGTYQLLVYPAAETGAVTFALRAGVDAGATAVDGADKVLTTTAGKYAETAVTVGAAARLSFTVTAQTFANTQGRLAIVAADGSLVYDIPFGNNASINLWPLPAGSYRFLFMGVARGAGGLTLTLSTPVNGGAITLNTAKTMTASKKGQATYYQFTGTAGQLLSMSYSGLTAGTYPWLDIRKTDGSYDSGAVNGGVATQAIPALPSAGTYEITLNPYIYTETVVATLKTRTAAAAVSGGAPALKAVVSSAPLARPVATKQPKFRKSPPVPPKPYVPGRPGDSWQPSKADLAGRGWSTGLPTQPGRSVPALSAPAGTTAITGQIETLDDKPLAHVTVGIEGVRVQTDARGQFLLSGVPSGHRVLRVDGSTASTAGRTFGLHDIGVDLTANTTTVLPYTIWLAKLDTAHTVSFDSPTRHQVTISTPAIPGLKVELPAGTVVRDVNGKVVTRLGITAIPVDRPPFPLPKSQVPSYFTVQPGSSYVFPAGARVIYPNFTHAKPGAKMDFWHYDPAGKGWFVYGKGTVTADGKSVEPDKGTEVYQFTGAMLISLGVDGPAPQWPVPGGGATGADPVDLGSGLLVDQHTDLSLDDTLPISVTRTYQQSDTGNRAFGVGMNFDYGLDLYSTNRYVDCWLILPDGGRVHFQRITPGSTDYQTAVFTADPTPTGFDGAVLAWNGNGWDLRTRDGTTYIFGLEAPLQAVRDKFGNQITITRDPGPVDSHGKRHDSGPITQITSPNGKWIKFTLDTAKRVTKAEDVLGRTVSYTYTADGHLNTVTDPGGNVLTYSYDAAGRLQTMKDARGTVYLTNEYDANGRVKTQTLPGNATYQLAYTTDPTGKVTATQLTDPLGHVRRVEFDASGFTTSDTSAYGTAPAEKTTITRDAATHLPTLTTDALGRQTRLTYDAYGNVKTVTELNGATGARTTSIDYGGPYDQVSKVTDPLGHATTYAYSANGALHTITDALQRVTTFDTDETGAVTAATEPAQSPTKYDYALGDVVKVTDPLGNATKAFTDAAGEVLRTSDPLGDVSTVSYTASGQVHTTVDPLGRTTAYDYDANGNLRQVTDAKQHITAYAYDTSDRLHTVTDPLNRVTTYTYDADGNLASTLTPRGELTKTTYDELGRPKLVRYGVSTDDTTQESQISYAYDLGDRLRTVTDSAAGTTTLTPDDYDRLSAESGPQGQVGYTYDAADRRKTMTVPGQSDVTYGYNDADQLTSVVRGADTVTIGYDTTGRRKSLLLPAGITQTYGYNAADELTSLDYLRGTAKLGGITYTPDALGRTTHVDGDYASVDLPAAYGPASYDAADQLTTAGPATNSYDPDGNLSTDGTATYTWNARGQLTGYAKPGLTVSYGYDGLGRRASKTAGSNTTGYLYDGLNTVQEKTGGSVSANLLTGGVDEVFSRTTSAGSNSLLTDALGSTIALANTTAVGAQYSYDPFGTTTVTGDDAGNPTRFAGREDDGNGLYYDRARYLSTSSARFISQDPLGLGSGSTNPYMYTFNQPTGLVDPMGTKPQGSEPGCEENSFVAGTRVLMADGSTKAIEQVRVGDQVEAADPSSGDRSPERVSATIVGNGDKHLVRVSTVDGGTVTATTNHPFWIDDDGKAATPGGRWVDAGELRHGDWLKTSDGRLVRVAGTHALNRHTHVYNLTVDTLHTYYVIFRSTPVLVHNTDDECESTDLYHGTNKSGAANVRANGVDTGVSSRPMDFGNGFYTTRSAKQAAEWASRWGKNGVVLHFKIPTSQLEALNSVSFSEGDSSLTEFVRGYRGGRTDTPYEMVEGPMLRNPGKFMKGSSPQWEGAQVTFFGGTGPMLDAGLQ